ncbi:hypothetical protein F4808DRAFT_70711 [Astrocystis sublimbata]|nr:hypothetical protein F4808DRAFT_70711 [Astrocystis sublimbata]
MTLVSRPNSSCNHKSAQVTTDWRRKNVLLNGPMSAPVETSPLLGMRSADRIYWPMLTCAFLFCFCFCCSFVPLIPVHAFETIFSPDLSSLLQSGLATDTLQEILWVHIRLILQDSAYQGASCGPLHLERRVIRKADCLGVMVRGCVLKLPATAIATWLSFRQAGLPIGFCILLSGVVLGLLVFNAIYFTSPLSLEIQVRKLARDDAVEAASSVAEEKQDCYIAAMKTWNAFVSIRRASLGCLLCVLFLYGGNHVTILRLAHHIISIDDAFDKMAQSAPKAHQILQLAQRSNSPVSVIRVAARRALVGNSMLLAEVPHFAALREKLRPGVKQVKK